MDGMRAWALANTVTGFATLFSGLMMLALTWLMHPQPRRWVFCYWLIVLTGVFTITLHGFVEAYDGPGPDHLWRVLDNGSNQVVAWALALGVLGDYYAPAVRRRWALAATTVLALGLFWLARDNPLLRERHYLVPLGAFGGFYGGETALITLSWIVAALFYMKRDEIPAHAKPLLFLTLGIFFCGMLLATASNSEVGYPFFAYHAIWHLVGAFGFIALWAFNHARFSPQAA